MDAAQEQRPPGQRARTEQIEPEAVDPAAPQDGGETKGHAHETENNDEVHRANRFKHGHTRQADRVGGNGQHEQKGNSGMTPENQPGNDVASRNINGTGRCPAAEQHRLIGILHERDIARDRHNHTADCGGDWQRGSTPRM
jgi:hypothetical protein